MTRRHLLSVLAAALLAFSVGCSSSHGRSSSRAALSRRAQIRQARVQAYQARVAAARNKNAITSAARNTVKAGQNLVDGVAQTIGKLW